MRISNVTIRNFRQLKDVNINFRRVEGRKDLHILYANNGVGKTNFLNAISWCLYGEESHLRNQHTSLFIPTNTVVNEIRTTTGTGRIEVFVSIQITTDGSEDYTFKRTETYNVNSDEVTLISKMFDVQHYNGSSENPIIDEDEQRQIINKYLPQEISNFFFFDGEQLEEFFSAEQLVNVKDGIQNLTQASYLKKVSSYLDTYLKRELSPKIREMGSDDLRNTEQIVLQLSESIEREKINIGIYSKQQKEAEAEVEKCSKIIHGCDSLPQIQQDHKKLEEKIELLEKDKKQKEQEIIVFAKEYFILFNYYNSISSFRSYIKNEMGQGHLPPAIDKNLLKDILETKTCPVCQTQHLPASSIEHIENLLKKLSVSSNASAILNQTVPVLDSLVEKLSNYKKTKTKLFGDYTRITEELTSTEEKLQKTENYLKSIPDADSIAKAIENKRIFQKLIEECIGNVAVTKRNIENFEAELKRATAKRDELLSSSKKLEAIKKKIDYVNSLNSILEETTQEVLDECRIEIQEQTFKIFTDLLSKEDAFSKVEIDSDYSFQVFDKFGQNVLGSCSAAETVLLALAFTLALQNVSKRDALLFIDTPVGRVDLDNRKNFMSTLLKATDSRQVILTFTPAEYSEGVKAILCNEYSSMYNLRFEDGITEIKKQ